MAIYGRRSSLEPRGFRDNWAGDLGMLLIIIVLILLFGGFGGGYHGYRQGHYGRGGFGIIGIIVLILIVVLIFGGGFGHGIYHRSQHRTVAHAGAMSAGIARSGSSIETDDVIPYAQKAPRSSPRSSINRF